MIQKCTIWKVFSTFADNPTKKFQIRELSRILRLAPTSVKLHLNYLTKLNLVKKEKEGIYDSFKANFDNDKFRFYKKINNLINIKKSGIVDYLNDSLSPNSIILFGSYSKGEDTESSDIDIFLLAKEKNIEFKKYEKSLNRKIQLFFSKDFKDIPIELKNNILNGASLYGYLKVF